MYHSFSTGTVRIWHANTYRLETTLNYGLERVWTIANMKGSNSVALGYDEGSVIIKVGAARSYMGEGGNIDWRRLSAVG